MNATIHKLPSRPVKRTVRLTRTPNKVMRPSGEDLSDKQVKAIIEAARGNRNGARDALMLELGWYHGLRVSELCALTWDDVRGGRKPMLFIRRAKGGEQHSNPLTAEHLRALNAMRPDEPGATIFVTELGEAFTPGAAQKMIARAARKAGIKFKVHPHQLRHACASHLAPKMNQLELANHLGLKNPANLAKYYASNPERRRHVW